MLRKFRLKAKKKNWFSYKKRVSAFLNLQKHAKNLFTTSTHSYDKLILDFCDQSDQPMPNQKILNQL